MQLSFCPKCKTQLGERLSQCSKCGVIFSKLTESDVLKSAAAGAAVSSSKKYDTSKDDSTFKNFKFVVLLIVVAGAIFGGKLYRDRKLGIDRMKAVGRSELEPSFVVYGDDEVATHMAVSSLRMRSEKVELKKLGPTSLQDDPALMKSLKDAGLADGSSVKLPAIQMDGKWVASHDEVEALLNDSYPRYFDREKPTAYVIVYGRDDDPYTQHTMDELRQAKIPFEYQNLSSSNEMVGWAEARMHASGFKKKTYQTPIVDVNGYVRPSLETSEIASRFAAKE